MDKAIQRYAGGGGQVRIAKGPAAAVAAAAKEGRTDGHTVRRARKAKQCTPSRSPRHRTLKLRRPRPPPLLLALVFSPRAAAGCRRRGVAGELRGRRGSITIASSFLHSSLTHHHRKCITVLTDEGQSSSGVESHCHLRTRTGTRR